MSEWKNMPSKKEDLTDIKNAIIYCFGVTKAKSLSHSELSFLLLKNYPDTKYPRNKDKKIYQEWEKQLKTPTGWIKPFRRYKLNVSNGLIQHLQRLLEEGLLIQDQYTKEYTFPSLKIRKNQIIKADHKAKLDSYDILHIQNLDNLTIYGIIPILDSAFSKEDVLHMKKIERQFKLLKNSFSMVENIFFTLNLEIINLRLNNLINRINKVKCDKKEKRLAFEYINDFFKNHDVFTDSFTWIEKKEGKQEYSLLLYIPENYSLGKRISYEILGFINVYGLDFTEEKTIVFIPRDPKPNRYTKKSFSKVYYDIEKKLKNNMKKHN
jgi:hypothetical protein